MRAIVSSHSESRARSPGVNSTPGTCDERGTRPVRTRPIPREQWTARMEAMGLPKAKTGPWEVMQDGFNSGWNDFGVPGTVPVAGTATPAEVFAQARKAGDASRSR